jgi:hypothetical protein
MHRYPVARVVAALLAVLSWPAMVFAQTAQLAGRITDATSAPLPGAVVTVTNAATGVDRVVVSDERGYYTLPFITPGTYRLTARRPGFTPATRALTLAVDGSVRVDFELQIAAIQEDVRVDATISPVQRGTSSLGQVLDDRTIVSLPVPGCSGSRWTLCWPRFAPTRGSRPSYAASACPSVERVCARPRAPVWRREAA